MNAAITGIRTEFGKWIADGMKDVWQKDKIWCYLAKNTLS